MLNEHVNKIIKVKKTSRIIFFVETSIFIRSIKIRHKIPMGIDWTAVVKDNHFYQM